MTSEGIVIELGNYICQLCITITGYQKLSTYKERRFIFPTTWQPAVINPLTTRLAGRCAHGNAALERGTITWPVKKPRVGEARLGFH